MLINFPNVDPTLIRKGERIDCPMGGVLGGANLWRVTVKELSHRESRLLLLPECPSSSAPPRSETF
jgi:hypothetical protein